MFKQNISTSYNLEDATYEIVIMLLVAFLLGFLLRFFLSRKTAVEISPGEEAGLLTKLDQIQTELKKSQEEKASLKKTLSSEYNDQIEALKIKLSTARADLEKCLASKATDTGHKDVFEKITGPADENNLRIIEGIGPALAKILNQAGILTYSQLAESNADALRKILSNAGSRFKVHDPSTWPQQARLAANGSWGELRSYKEKLNAGKF